MLPTANCTFKILSLSDDVEVSCRLYFPRFSSVDQAALVSGFAIFAHPYAPMGGCYDDPVVQSIGSILLTHKFVLCTFNFRGAPGSSGSTSWTGKAELADYVTVYGFMLRVMNEPSVAECISMKEGKPLLVLGGYSYGSMIASHLPELGTIITMLETHAKEDSDHEIELRTQEVSKLMLAHLEAQAKRGRSSLRSSETPNPVQSAQEVLMGGYESDGAHQRARQNSSRRSIDVQGVRRSIERVRQKFNHKGEPGSRSLSEIRQAATNDNISTTSVVPKIAYLLVSPLLGPVSGLTTMFSRLVYENRGEHVTWREQKPMTKKLSESPTLAVFGDRDIFTSARKLRKWAVEVENMPSSRFVWKAIPGAGHFWHERETQQQLYTSVSEWIRSQVDY